MSKELYKNVCNEKVLAQCYTNHAKDLYRYLYYKFGSNFNSEDRIQDAFIKLWENCKKVTPKTAKAFLFKVANNMMLNDVRHQKVVLNYVKIKPKEYTNESPEFIMQKEEFLLSYQKALTLLSEDQRVAFTLNKMEGKSYGEIAELLGVTDRVVEYRVVSAYKKLKYLVEGFNLK